jgi:hypothetical protein
MTRAEPALSFRTVGRLAWTALWWAIALGGLWQLARVVL